MTDAERHQECMEIACEALERFQLVPGEAGKHARAALAALHIKMDPAAQRQIVAREHVVDDLARVRGAVMRIEAQLTKYVVT